MRRIETEEQRETRAVRNKRIGSIFIIGLLVFSSLGFAYYSGGGGQEQVTDDGQGQGVNPYGLIEIERGQETFYFTYYPETFSEVPVELSRDYSYYQGREVFLDVKNDFALQEISLNLGRYASRLQKACYGECLENLPEVGCDKNVIVYRESEDERVYSQDGCVFIEGNMKAVDAFIFNVFNLG